MAKKKTTSDKLYEELTKGLKASNNRSKIGEEEFNKRLKKIRLAVLDKIFNYESSFGIFGMPDKDEDAVQYIKESFDNSIKKIVKEVVKEELKEYDKKRKLEPVCPVCKSSGDMIEDIRHGNGVFGPGYHSSHVNYECRKCGVMFDKPRGAKEDGH